MLHVAVGVVRNALNQILIAHRAAHQHQGGLWEFPGGKVEQGESVASALKRELNEELAISPTRIEPLITITHHYTDRSVMLDVWEVTGFSGDPEGREGQPIRWVDVADLSRYAFPEANMPIVRAIELPHCIALSGAFHSISAFRAALDNASCKGATGLLLRLVDPLPPGVALAELLGQVAETGHDLILHSKTLRRMDVPFDQVKGLHLDRHAMASFHSRPPDLKWLGASCHNLDELKYAQAIGCDYVFLSPVKATSSHPDQTPLGWQAFSEMVKEIALPVYALGGLDPVDVTDARSFGAQGVACLSSCWEPGS